MRSSAKLIASAAVLVLASVVGTATPAAATSPVEVTSGTLTTVLGNFDLTPGSEGTPPCPEKPSTVQLTGSTGPDRWTLSGTFSGQFQRPPGSGNWFQLDRTVLGGSGGAWAGTAPVQALNGVIGIQARLYQTQVAGNPPNCEKTNVRCIYSLAYTLQGTSTYKAATGAPGLPTTTTGDAATIDATSGQIFVTSCPPPFNALGGTIAQFTDLQLTVQ